MKENIIELQHMDILQFRNWARNLKDNQIIYDTTGTADNVTLYHNYSRIRVDFNPNTITLLDSKQGRATNYIEFKNVEHVIVVADAFSDITRLFIKCENERKEHTVSVA